MPYEKTTWKSRDLITASKMNNIENGIETAGEDKFIRYDDEQNLTLAQKAQAQSNIGIDGSTLTISNGIPPHGTAGQILRKISDTDYDTEWANLSYIPTPNAPATGAFLVYNGTAWVAQTLSIWQGGNY